MSDNPAQQVLSDLLNDLESLEAQSGAILQFLKEKGIAADEQLAPYLERAASAASVKWRAARVRMEHLFAVSEPAPAQSAPKQPPADSPTKPEAAPKESGEAKAPKRETEVRLEPSKKPAEATEAQAGDADGRPTKDAAAESTEPPTSSKDQTSRESEHPELEQQKAS